MVRDKNYKFDVHIGRECCRQTSNIEGSGYTLLLASPDQTVWHLPKFDTHHKGGYTFHHPPKLRKDNQDGGPDFWGNPYFEVTKWTVDKYKVSGTIAEYKLNM